MHRETNRVNLANTPNDTERQNEAKGSSLRDTLRRLLSLLVAFIGLTVTVPVMLLIALVIKLTAPGPVIYSQFRVGVNRRTSGERRARSRGRLSSRRWRDQGGRPFTIYKFRTMTAVTDGPAEQVWASAEDPRITSIGQFLRKYRLDEFPQLYNVLRGDMNLVGPRPEQPEIFARLSNLIERYTERQRVLPGITGWAQVNHHYDTNDEDVRRKVALDLQYIDRRSPVEDLRIMARTVPVMMLKKGSL